MVPERFQDLILGICEYVILIASRILQIWLRVQILKWEISLDYPGEPNLITRVKSREPFLDGSRRWDRRRRKRESKHEKYLICQCWLWQKRVRRAKECGWPLEAENSLQLTTRKEMEISVLQPQGNGFCQQPEWARQQICPKSLQKEM